jgi:uncharacterized OsmC-like protein
MVDIKVKEKLGQSTRSVESVCASGVRCDVSAPEGNTIIIDEPEHHGGENAGASPLAHLTAALATCQSGQTTNVAEAMRFKHGAIRIKCTTTTDRLPGIEGNDKVLRFASADLDIEIESDEPENRIERLKALAEDKCPVGNLLNDAGAAVTIKWTVVPLNG